MLQSSLGADDNEITLLGDESAITLLGQDLLLGDPSDPILEGFWSSIKKAAKKVGGAAAGGVKTMAKLHWTAMKEGAKLASKAANLACKLPSSWTAAAGTAALTATTGGAGVAAGPIANRGVKMFCRAKNTVQRAARGDFGPARQFLQQTPQGQQAMQSLRKLMPQTAAIGAQAAAMYRDVQRAAPADLRRVVRRASRQLARQTRGKPLRPITAKQRAPLWRSFYQQKAKFLPRSQHKAAFRRYLASLGYKPAEGTMRGAHIVAGALGASDTDAFTEEAIRDLVNMSGLGTGDLDCLEALALSGNSMGYFGNAVAGVSDETLLGELDVEKFKLAQGLTIAGAGIATAAGLWMAIRG